jgi:hypothetical protein
LSPEKALAQKKIPAIEQQEGVVDAIFGWDILWQKLVNYGVVMVTGDDKKQVTVRREFSKSLLGCPERI